MGSLTQVDFSPQDALHDTDAFLSLLDRHRSLSERADLTPFFRDHPQFSASLGLFHPDIGIPDCVAFEYSFLGNFTADLVVGDSVTGAFTLVELEDATSDSLFKTGNRQSSYWSRRFERGISQIVDWLCELSSRASETLLRQDFGTSHPEFATMLLIGRSQFLSLRERERLRWYRRNVRVNARHVDVRTFDDVAQLLRRRLRHYSAASNL